MKKISLTLVLAACILASAWIVGAKTKVFINQPGTPDPAPVIQPDPIKPVTVKDGSLTMTVEPENTSILEGSNGEMFLRIGLSAVEAEILERRPLNLALVIDRSGSMSSRGKLDYAKQAAEALVDRLGRDDRLAIVIYDDYAELLLPSTKLTDPQSIKKVIAGISTRGSTNLSDGLTKGQRQVNKHFDNEAINRVIVLSDGLANRGITSRDELSRLVAGWGEAGIRVTSMGLGASFNEDLMTELALASGGKYYFIEAPAQLAGIYETELKTLMQTVAKDVTISLELDDGVAFNDVYGYKARVKGSLVEIPVGVISSGQDRKIIVKLDVPADQVGRVGVSKVRLNYRDTLAGAQEVKSLARVDIDCITDIVKVEALRNVSVLSDKENVKITEENKVALQDLKSGKKDKAVRWYEKKLKYIEEKWADTDNAALQSQRVRMRQELDEIKTQAPEGEDLSNFAKQSKMEALGYVQ